MKVVKVTSTAILSLLLGIAAPAYAQQEQHGEKQDHHEQEAGKHEQGKPEREHGQQQRQDQYNQQEHAQQQRRQDQYNQQEHAQQQQQQQHAQQQRTQRLRQDENRQQEHARQQRAYQPPPRAAEQRRIEHSAWQEHRARSWQSDHRTWQQRGGYRGYRIPDDRYRGYFGPEHGFRINTLPFRVVGGYPRFQYNGYWISALDPWPEYWANDWYDTDDVYVNYADNGYYLYNRRYPTAPGIAISISF